MLFDSHAHYNDERFKDDVDEVLSAMNENNVGLIIRVRHLTKCRIYLRYVKNIRSSMRRSEYIRTRFQNLPRRIWIS